MPDCNTICHVCPELLHDEGEGGTACRNGTCLDNVVESYGGWQYHEDCYPGDDEEPEAIDACNLYAETLGPSEPSPTPATETPGRAAEPAGC